VFVLALDGATYDLLEPWMAAGELPNLKKLYEAGAHGRLHSTIPPLTGPAWATFMTGKSPANHGLLEFFRRASGSYKLELNSRADVDGQSIWRVLSDAGKRVGVLGVPLTWPPESVNGFLVTGLLTPRAKDVVFTHPPELGGELHKALGRYLLQHTEKYVQDDPMRLADEEFAILENKLDAASYLMDKKPWDFFMLHILGTDVLQHGFWHHMDPSHPQHTKEGGRRYGGVILDYYRRVDARLPELLERIPPDSYVLVMSDHGFGPLRLYVNFNTWLLQQGFLHIKRTPLSMLRYAAFRLGYHYRAAWNIGARLGIVRLVIRLGRSRQENAQRSMFLSLDDVDWSRTTVYSVGNFGQMYVNLSGREPEGCVEPGDEYDRVLTKLEDALRRMRDPETGEPVIGEILRGSDVWHGRYAERAPDLFFFTTDMKYKAMGLSDFGSDKVFEALYGTRAHHKMDGVFMLSGPGVRRDEEIKGADLRDLAPTIYHLMGVPAPDDLDGTVLRDCLTGKLASREVAVRVQQTDTTGDGQSGYTPEEEAALTDMLRDLGYVS
jgi:predicted AlkP superfamily phosphohydrolase/phosphomutase